MRTTLTLEPVVAERINRIVATRGQSMKEVVNEALREGLKIIENSAARPARKFMVEPRSFGIRPGIDLDTIGRLADDLEDDARIKRLNLRKRA
jgi:hypothetical protein